MAPDGRPSDGRRRGHCAALRTLVVDRRPDDRRKEDGTGAAHRAASPPALTALVGELLGRGGGMGLDTSGGLLFNHSLWARDRVITALDLLDDAPQVAVETVLALAALQGTRHRALSEEGPGRIHNEHRDMRAWQAPLWLKALFGLAISTMWGGTPTGYTTYFSSDSTPLFVWLVAAVAQREPGILEATVVRKDGRLATVRDGVIEACGWIEEHLSPAGLVEVGRSNPLALQQVWKDAPTSNFDERGRMPNVLRPMAYLDVQVLAAEALGRAARLPAGRAPERLAPERLAAESRAIRDATIAHFWLPERHYFGHAIDRGPDGRPRLLRSVQSNAGWMLATGFFDELPAAQRKALVGGIVRTLFSAELLTAAGIRGRALADHNPRFRNYHENVWPVDTAMIARGLRRQGLEELADQLEARLVNVANMLGGVFEFVAVDGEGRVVDPRLSADGAARLFGHAVPGLPTEMVPDEPMGWTATALLAVKRGRARRAREGRALAERLAARPAWLTELTRDVLASIESVEVCATRAELEERYVALAPAYLDHRLGLRRSAGTVLAQGLCGVLPRELGHWARHEARRRIDSSEHRGRARGAGD